MAARQLAEELPALSIVRWIAARTFQLLARPKNRPLSAGVETFRIEQSALVVIAEDAHLALHHQIDALARVRSVPDDVAQAEDFGDSLGADVGQHGLERFEVAVDVANESSLHREHDPMIRTPSG